MADSTTEMYRTRADTLATEAGSGPELLCAHGSLMDRTMYTPQLEALSDEYRVATYDLRARTERATTAYDLWDLADDCHAVVDGLEMDQPVIAGMSMGGFMALRFALEYPDSVSGLVLIDAISQPHPEDDVDLYRGMIDQLRDAEAVPENTARTASQFLFGETTREENPELVESWIDRWTTYPGKAVYQEIGSWLDREDVTDRLEEIDVPALVVHGEEDASLDVEQAEPMADALGARMEVVPDAGHSSNLEQPEAVNDAIRQFLETVYN
ncbi:alpha/beta fold hydrolase [Natronobacterium gregoryi]|uniref:Alpha/beta hydrolase n=2 Tax=Natronobacterium gregoryi TaxID=44930 RepID=L0AFB6_NATGS|nr:alpha/beta hydrolase [Natronobacterium gregoryi]AFZ72114.1 putative hydrolase or acyltransferase of alpha/beta superfamily [Natronobacterium gregoryi SP2]PLK20088.1 alpha/beta hydrolase [Natronobacterium gregoryi SP2]SFJ58457.1 Pimeloyl-ACP methyl ester carboxylesterase [Natronobacterium gregoryi]